MAFTWSNEDATGGTTWPWSGKTRQEAIRCAALEKEKRLREAAKRKRRGLFPKEEPRSEEEAERYFSPSFIGDWNDLLQQEDISAGLASWLYLNYGEHPEMYWNSGGSAGDPRRACPNCNSSVEPEPEPEPEPNPPPPPPPEPEPNPPTDVTGYKLRGFYSGDLVLNKGHYFVACIAREYNAKLCVLKSYDLYNWSVHQADAQPTLVRAIALTQNDIRVYGNYDGINAQGSRFRSNTNTFDYPSLTSIRRLTHNDELEQDAIGEVFFSSEEGYARSASPKGGYHEIRSASDGVYYKQKGSSSEEKIFDINNALICCDCTPADELYVVAYDASTKEIHLRTKTANGWSNISTYKLSQDIYAIDVATNSKGEVYLLTQTEQDENTLIKIYQVEL